jgi:hypothetical protein
MSGGWKRKIGESDDFEGLNSTGSIAIKIIIINLTELSERRCGLKVSEFR